MPGMTGNDIINEALLLNGVIYPGQTISPEAAATSQFGFNLMLGEWSAQGLAVFSVVRNTFALQAGKADYTIGAASDFVSIRPEKIDAWEAHNPTAGSNGGAPVDGATFALGRTKLEADAWKLALAAQTALTAIRVSLLDYAAPIATTAWETAIPAGTPLVGIRTKLLNYDAAYPVGNIHMYPVPVAGMTLDLWMWQQFSLITDFTLALDFPPGYLKAILYNLAVDLAPKFGRPLDPDVANIANQCKSGLGSTNAGEHSTEAPKAAQ